MAENQSKCTGNCMACTIFQRQYCASQLAYSNMRMLEKMQESIAGMQQKIDAMQNCEAGLFDPTKKPAGSPAGVVAGKGIAQSGDGAENRGPETINQPSL